MPKLAVCVPCFNEAPYIEDCLRSISENDLDDIQIYVEDNNQLMVVPKKLRIS